MASMADKINKSSKVLESEKGTRESASRKEHSKSPVPRSVRFTQDQLTQIEEIRVAAQQRTGRIPTITEVIFNAIAEMHERSVKNK